MPAWMNSYPKTPQLPDPIYPDDARGYRKIDSNGKLDLWWSARDTDVILTPHKGRLRDNVGYARLFNYYKSWGTAEHVSMKFPKPFIITDVYVSPEYQGGAGSFFYKGLMKRGFTIVSGTSLNPNSAGLWRKLHADPEVNVWAMHPRSTKMYPLRNAAGKLEPVVPESDDALTFQDAVFFASMKINPLGMTESVHTPDTVSLYHGTSIRNAERLLNYGWSPNSSIIGSNGGSTQYLYLTNEFDNAKWYADRTDDPVVILVKNIPIQWLKVDPDDGVEDTVLDELNNPLGLPGNVVLHHALSVDHFTTKTSMTEAQFIPTQGDQRYHHHRIGDDAVMVWMDPKVFLKQAPSMGSGYDPHKDEMVQHWAEWLRAGRPLDGLELGGENGHDGRHRAWGAILAGVDLVPVYVEPDMAEFYLENDMAELHESLGGVVYHVTERGDAEDI
jgi:hypothetical protein